MITTAIIYDHRYRAKRGELGPVEIRVTIDRRPYYINTGVRVYMNEWKHGTIVNRPDCHELNRRLDIILQRVEAYINECLEHDVPIDVADVRRRVLDHVGAESGAPFIEWCDAEIEKMTIKKDTKKHYRTLMRRLGEYGKLNTWASISVEGIRNFDSWLHALGGLTDAAIYNYHKCLKRLLTIADQNEKINRNPYERLKGQFKRGDKENVEYLTEEEMTAICALQYEKGSTLDRALTLFIFQMYTGMAYADMSAFDINNYKKTHGKWIYRTERIKSGVPFASQLLPPVVKVLKRYDMQLPLLDNADYNHTLKIIGEAAGITTTMHSHLARHTFATYMLRNGVKIENLAKMLGHTNIIQTQRYAKVLAQSVHDEFDKIEAIMKKDL